MSGGGIKGGTWQTELNVSANNVNVSKIEVRLILTDHCGDNIALSLKDPTGTSYSNSTIACAKTIIVSNPKSGLWNVTVNGNSVTQEVQRFKITAKRLETEPQNIADKTGGINFTQASLNYISICNPENGLEVVMKGTEANASKGDSIINITNATIEATDAFLTGLIIPDYKMWITMDTKPGNGFAGLVGDVSRVDDLYSVQFFKCKGYPEFIFFIVKKYRKGDNG